MYTSAPPGLQMAQAQNATDRCHARLWQVGPDVVGNVQHDAGSPHVVDLTWAAAEWYVANLLCSSWCGHAPLSHQQAIQDGPAWRGLERRRRDRDPARTTGSTGRSRA